MNNTLFLLGAGFNRDVTEEAGPIDCKSIYIEKYKITPKYPLIADMRSICFPKETAADSSKSIEVKIQEHMSRNDMEPLKLLCEEISKCDYYLVPPLIQSESCYRRFFDRFSHSHFLTFNYDALLEVFLLIEDWERGQVLILSFSEIFSSKVKSQYLTP